MSLCQYCQKQSVEEIETGELVCISCGSLHDDFIIEARPTDIGSASKSICGNMPKHIRPNSKVQKSNGEKLCLNLIHSLASDFKMNDITLLQVTEQFSNLYKLYKSKSTAFKKLIAASCVFAFLKFTNAAFTVGDFCTQVGVTTHKLLSMYNKIKDQLTISESSATREGTLRAILKSLPQSTKEERENFCMLIQKTLKILTVSEKAWLVTGRSLEAMMIACAYVAWRSMNNYAKNNFSKFCHLCNVTSKQKTASLRLKEIKGMFIKLGENLSSATRQVDEKNVWDHVDSIIYKYINNNLESVEEGDDSAELQRFKQFRRVRESDPSEVSVEPVINCEVSDEDLIKDEEWSEYIRPESEIAIVKQVKTKCGLPC